MSRPRDRSGTMSNEILNMLDDEISKAGNGKIKMQDF